MFGSATSMSGRRPPTASECAAKRRRLSAPLRSQSKRHSLISPVYCRAHGQARETMRIDFTFAELLESLLRGEVRSVVEEDQGEPEVPLREARHSSDRQSE